MSPAPSVARRLRPDLLWRAAVAVAGLAAGLVSAPAPVTATLVLGGALLAAERLAALRRRGRLDVVLVSLGGVLVALVLVGLALGATPVGLHARTWAVSLGLLSLVANTVAALAPRPLARRVSRPQVQQAARVAPWLVAGLVVVVAAVGISERSVSETSVPPLQMSLGRVDGSSVDVVVSSGTEVGPLEVRTILQGSEVSYPLFTARAGVPTTVRLALPAQGRYTIALGRPDQSQALRTLVIDR